MRWNSHVHAVRIFLEEKGLRIGVVVVAAAAVIITVSWWGFTLLNPIPPRTVVMTTGPEGGAYHEFGERYRKVLAEAGVRLTLLQSDGSVENLARLRESRSGVRVGFLQGGTVTGEEAPGLVSLGNVFYEPLWFFHRGVIHDGILRWSRGRRISIGPEGSGTRVLSLSLLARKGIDQRVARLLALAPEVAEEKLLRGEIDGVMMVASWESPVVQRLLAARDVQLTGFTHPDAYTALYPYLNKLEFPAGVRDMINDRPPAPVTLLAPEASLVVREDLHPAIQYLLLDAASRIHSGPGIFQRAGEFPSPESVGLPLSDYARNFYRVGRPFLQRYFPFWLAVLLGNLLLLLLPVVGVLYPLLKIMPAVYGWGVRRRIYRLYDELKRLETELGEAGVQGEDDLMERIDQLENRANHLWVPMSHMHMLYNFRRDIEMVRARTVRPISPPGSRSSETA